MSLSLQSTVTKVKLENIDDDDDDHGWGHVKGAELETCTDSRHAETRPGPQGTLLV